VTLHPAVNRVTRFAAAPFDAATFGVGWRRRGLYRATI
jgi:hypothetical protein